MTRLKNTIINPELSNLGVTQLEKITSRPLPALAGCKQRSCGGIVIPVVAGCSSAVSLKKVAGGHPYRMKTIIERENMIFEPFIKDIPVDTFQSSYHLPEVYVSSGAIYTRKRNLLDEYNGEDFALGDRPGAVVLNEIESIDVNTNFDFKLAEFFLNEN